MSQDLTIRRYGYTPMGTFGVMAMPSGENLYTVERPWLNNAPEVSCIPEGVYNCAPRRYNRGGYQAVEVQSVPGRSYILFHRGNTMHHSAGCILVNSRFGCIDGVWAGADSRTAFKEFMKNYGSEPFSLKIESVTGGVIVPSV